MYYLKEFDYSVTLPPEFLVPGVGDLVNYRVQQQLTGTCGAQHGYVLAVLGITPKSPGNVLPGSGQVRFQVRCQALVAHPLKSQVVDIIVSSISKLGIFGAAGPVQVFVSNKLLPREYRFEEGCFRADELGLRIAVGEAMRVRIIGTKIEQNEIFAIGSIKEDYLGPLKN